MRVNCIMRCFGFLALCVLQIALGVRATGHYSVIAPGTIHPEHKYSVTVGVHDVNQPCKFKVGVVGPDYSDFKTVDLQSNELTTVDFEVPLLKSEGAYNITVEGISGLVFKNTTELDYREYQPLVKIQTDKGKYKPGDVVNFRVIFLDENLRPAPVTKDMYIWIEDAKRNRIKKYKDVNVVKGVYTDLFQLSEFAMLGRWRIIVKHGEKYYISQVYFEVDKYVLPKYTVKVEATEDVSARDGDMQVVVRANYTYGKPVNAKVTLVLTMDNSYYDYDNPENVPTPAPTTIKTADMVEGKAKFNLNIKEYADYMPNNSTSYFANIQTKIEENFAGVMINSTTRSTFYPNRYSINCITYNECGSFHADEETKMVVLVSHVDKSKVDDTKSVVKLHFNEVLSKLDWYAPSDEAPTTIEPPVSGNKEFVFESHLNGSSMAVFKVKLDDLAEYDDYSHYYKMKAEFIDETHELYSTHQLREPKHVEPPEPPKKEPTEWIYVNAYHQNGTYSSKIGKPVTISINSSALMPYFVYHVIGRANVLHSERVVLQEPAKLHNFTVVTTFMMTPHSNIYVYFIDEHGELHYGETNVYTEVALQNKIEITTPEEAKPGDEVALKIKTPVHSFVGLMAVDQSVLLLDENNDIGLDDFRWRLGSYSTRTPWPGGYSQYPGDKSGVVTLTNADYFYNFTKPEWAQTSSGDRSHHRTRTGGAGHGNVASTFASTPAEDNETDVPETKSIFGLRQRKDFSETWFFTNVDDTQTEEFTWKKTIPDTITSWVISAFSLNEEKGLGVVEERSKVRTFQPFFVSLRLPYAVKRGEVINIPALVSNYLTKDLDVEVILENTDNEYEFVEPSNEAINELKRVKTVRVPTNSARGVSFMLRPTIIGNIMLKFVAISPIAGDAIHKTLKVVPEGVTQYANRAYFVNLKDNPEFDQTFDLALPEEVVPDSQHIEFGVVGDLLGPVFNNLDNVLRMPLGCGEQTTSTIMINYLVLSYLKDTNKLTDVLERKIKRNLETGYQNILGYRNDDGSYGSFGWLRYDTTQNGSTWLTAYVTRALHNISPFIEVNSKVIKAGLDFLVQRQAENGSFIEYGDYFFDSQNQHLTRTASVILTFIENDLSKPTYQTAIDKGFKYLLENVEKTEDLQTRTLVAYALHRAKHSAAFDHIKHLKTLAKSDEDRMWWSNRDETKSNYWWRWSHSDEVEVTSHILLMLLDLESENTQSVLPIVKWLVAQRNSIGGFSSTHDTILGLEALTKFAQKSGYEPALMDIDFTAKGSDKKDSIKVTDDNALLLQTVELPQKTVGVDFHAKGKGAALIQVAYQYNIVEKEKTPSFAINTVINKDAPAYKLEMDVCVEYTGEGQGSNMAILEISLPSGYVADVEQFREIEKVDRVRDIETKNKESVIVIYFDSLHKEDVKCLPVIAYRQFPVAMQKPASIVLYDYYETSRKATTYYAISSKLCEICEEDEECKKVCH